MPESDSHIRDARNARARSAAQNAAETLSVKPTGIVQYRSRGRVLIIGHSNTVPRVLEQFGYPNEITIDHDEYDNLFIIVPAAEGPPLVLRQRMVLPTSSRKDGS